MKRVILILLLLACSGFAQQAVPEIPFRSVPDFLKLPPDMYLGEVAGRCRELQGPRVRVLARQRDRPGLRRSRGAAARVRLRTASSSAKSATTSMPGRSRTPSASTSARQHLGHGQGLGHGHQVQPGGPGGDGVRPQEGSVRRSAEPLEPRHAAAAAGHRPVPPANRRDLGPAGRTSSSATATSTRAWPSSTRTATG